MDSSIQRALGDKFYDKRKLGALDLERVVRNLVASRTFETIDVIIDQLCNDFAYQSSIPHARNGGLIGLAAAAIALGHELPQYLRKLIPPVLACFTDPEARVRYYACESMYNIAKVAKGEILYFFNHLFDCLCKLCTDHELSVKNGAELLDRLIKDIVSENAVEYQSVVPKEKSADDDQGGPDEYELAFSLPKFIPLLKERILVTNPYARQFLVGWIELLDGIPDLELVSYLPDFLTGLLRFLSDENRDVHIATRKCLDRFLSEIKRIARIRKGIAESKKSNEGGKRKRVESVDSDSGQVDLEDGDHNDSDGYDDDEGNLDELQESEEEWQPGQDVEIDYSRILDILTSTLENDTSLGNSLGDGTSMGNRVVSGANPAQQALGVSGQDPETTRSPTPTQNQPGISGAAATAKSKINTPVPAKPTPSPTPSDAVTPSLNLNYAAAVNSLTLLFLNDHEETRVAAMTWLIMLHKRSSRKVLTFNDITFPALLKTLSDTSEAVVVKDLQLLSQIACSSEDDYFTKFMVDLLRLFFSDRSLLETRGNLIIRQLCVNLSPEKIYRTLADCIEKEDDIEFASIMVQNLNNNLITAPQLTELRKRLRNLDTKPRPMNKRIICFKYFTNTPHHVTSRHTTSSAEFDMTVNLLIQIDKLVQLIESPMFTLLAAWDIYTSLRDHTLVIHSSTSAPSSSSSSFDRSNRLKGRDDNSIRWGELLEKFRSVQERSRRAQGRGGSGHEEAYPLGLGDPKVDPNVKSRDRSQNPQLGVGRDTGPVPSAPAPKPKSGLGRQFGRLSGRGKKGQ
ncbi:Vacuole-associated enzyme activator complex component [Ceratocystis lukuohia]|uniref:Vacuole-associated enzyme activator complex component n=1 Tax=Ceratocystis lukuohia TaxID=2019550 RepID=A0ABR4ML99_9PEZI